MHAMTLALHPGQERGARRWAVMAEEDSQPVWAADGGALKRLQHCTVCGFAGRLPARGKCQNLRMFVVGGKVVSSRTGKGITRHVA